MAWMLKYTGQFKKDLKRYKHDAVKIKNLQVVLNHLEENGIVPEAYKPHMLKGDYEGFMECHVENDFLLIWIDDTNSSNYNMLRSKVLTRKQMYDCLTKDVKSIDDFKAALKNKYPSKSSTIDALY